MIPGLVASGKRSALWTPATRQATLKLWQDASDTSTITASGGVVSQWRDKSGNGWHASPTGAGPITGSVTIGGLNALNFLNKGIANAAFSQAQPFTFGFVYRLQNTSASGGFAFTPIKLGQVYSSKFCIGMQYYAPIYGPSANTSPHVVTGVMNGALSFMEVDGVRYTPTTEVSTAGAGGISYGTDGGLQADVGEMVMFSETFGDLNLSKLRAYLGAKWGITTT